MITERKYDVISNSDKTEFLRILNAFVEIGYYTVGNMTSSVMNNGTNGSPYIVYGQMVCKDAPDFKLNDNLSNILTRLHIQAMKIPGLVSPDLTDSKNGTLNDCEEVLNDTIELIKKIKERL